MNPTISLKSRNQFVLTLFISSFAIVNIIYIFNFSNEKGLFPFPVATAIFILLLLFIKNINGRLLRIFILLLMNSSVFTYAWFHLELLSITWLLVVCFFATLYYSLQVTSSIIGITIFEFLLFATQQPQLITSLPAMLLIILLLLIIIGTQTYFIHTMQRGLAQKKRYSEHLTQSRESYLMMFFEQAKDAIAVVDLDNRVIDMNPAFEKLYGWNRDECIGKVTPFVPPENMLAAQQRFKKLHSGENIPAFETIDMRKDGRRIHVQLSMSPIFNRQQQMLAISIIAQDIAYKKEAERQLLQSEKLAVAGEIAAGVAHEIRNPLTAISGFIQMMNQDKDSPYYTYTQIIQSELERINLIISEFLVLSKPHVENKKNFSLTNVCLTIATFLQFEFQQKDIHFEQSIPIDDFIIFADENQIKQVLLNLLRNSIEAVHYGGEISLRLYAKDDHTVTIALKDNGIGMDEEVLSQIFEPFFTTKTHGTGLGMMLTNKIIQSSNGSISIDSAHNEGTTISIDFPRVKL
ncbi:two-component system sensor histidine kinase NtrB [Caryophanon tenue]|uniref:histidine kinase n=1 Tax=Caryophanon tenue TaxID=33978 RepID=A0A1C0YJY4_9BACL|nr:ATP-binding protein [Caryophanon tenue]OCS87495.1 hypothetical protein A6M13_09305 [Caryophanon tenue]